MPKAKDYTGQTVGNFKVLALSHKGPARSNTVWLTECLNCGDVKPRRIHQMVRRPNVFCKNCGGYAKGEVGCKRIMQYYQINAKLQKREWALTAEQFRQITSLPCHYCGVAPSQTGYQKNYTPHSLYLFNGIDRKDNVVGYTEENSLPCAEAGLLKTLIVPRSKGNACTNWRHSCLVSDLFEVYQLPCCSSR